MTETTASGAAQDGTGARKGLTISRINTRDGVHPYDEVTWERRDVVMTNWRDGSVNFEQRGVEFPDFWSVNAANIVTTKYFRGAVGTAQREWSLKQLVDRVVGTYTAAGREHGYFATDADAEIFNHELTYALIHQVFSFNSPVWFNVGTSSPQQVSACQPYDALVSTPQGPMPIGSLVEGDAVGTKVHDAYGTTRVVAVKANGVKDVLRVHTFDGQSLDVTADHLVWRATDLVVGEFTVAGFLRVGDHLLDVSPDFGGSDRRLVKISKIERLGPMEVYDIQTESGEYLSGSTASLRVHNCFILAVDDTMDSILEWYREEGLIFKGGSGAGVNLSRIRSSKELLSSGGTASGPVSFMRGADASAGTIKSGGATRRAAKMVVLDVDHPDIEDFVVTKAREEEKVRVLRDAGFDMDLGGKDIISVQYQNANNSVRVSDEFMRAVEEDGTFGLAARRTGEVVQTVEAKKLFRQMAQAAWDCADPGIQYDSTINDWHTCPESGRITASNPCSEYVHLDNSSCNLASINLLKFLRDDDTFDVERFEKITELIITAMDISICFADFPTEKITATTRAYRQLGIGYANLGALLMATGHAYDSEGGRAIAAAITALMTGTAYRRSAELAAVVGPYDGYARNATAHKRVMTKHAAASAEIKALGGIDDANHSRPPTRSGPDCLELGEANGYRNAQASLLAPTGTIGLMMDCDTTGVEPDLALVKFKKLVGGGSMQIVNQTVPRALKNLGYQPEQAEAIIEYISEHGHVVDAPGLRPEHYEVFDCAMGERAISPMGHVRMMAAVQPALSGVDLQDREPAGVRHRRGRREDLLRGLEARPEGAGDLPRQLQGGPAAVDREEEAGRGGGWRPGLRRRMRCGPCVGGCPSSGTAMVTRFSVAGAEGYMTASSYPDDGDRRGLPQARQAGLDPGRRDGRVLDGDLGRPAVRDPAGVVRGQVHEHAVRPRRDHRRPGHPDGQLGDGLHLPPPGPRPPVLRPALGAGHPVGGRAVGRAERRGPGGPGGRGRPRGTGPVGARGAAAAPGES